MTPLPAFFPIVPKTFTRAEEDTFFKNASAPELNREVLENLPLPAAQNREALKEAFEENFSDWKMFYTFYKTLSQAMEERKTSVQLGSEEIQTRHNISKKIMNEFMEIWKKSETTEGISKALGHLSGASTLLFFAALAAGFVTGGAIAAFSILQAGAGFTGGTAALAKAITDSYKQNQQGTAFILREEHAQNLNEIKDLTKKTQESYEAVDQLVGMLSQALSARRETARLITN